MLELVILAVLIVIAWGVAPELVEGAGMVLAVIAAILALALVIGSGGLGEVLRYFGVAALFVAGLGGLMWLGERDVDAQMAREQAERELAERARWVTMSRSDRVAENEWTGIRGWRR